MTTLTLTKTGAARAALIRALPTDLLARLALCREPLFPASHGDAFLQRSAAVAADLATCELSGRPLYQEVRRRVSAILAEPAGEGFAWAVFYELGLWDGPDAETERVLAEVDSLREVASGALVIAALRVIWALLGAQTTSEVAE